MRRIPIPLFGFLLLLLALALPHTAARGQGSPFDAGPAEVLDAAQAQPEVPLAFAPGAETDPDLAAAVASVASSAAKLSAARSLASEVQIRIALAAFLGALLKLLLDFITYAAKVSPEVKKRLPLVCLAIGAAASGVDAFGTGSPWWMALIVGVGGVGAIVFNEIGNAIRKKAGAVVAGLVLVVSSASIAACGATKATVAYNAGAATLVTTQPVIRAIQKRLKERYPVIPLEAAEACAAEPEGAPFLACFEKEHASRKKPLDAARLAVFSYDRALAAGGDVADGNVAAAGAALFEAAQAIGAEVAR